jgi:hypothetical protein
VPLPSIRRIGVEKELLNAMARFILASRCWPRGIGKLAVIAAVLASAGGCGSSVPTARLAGKVLLGGKPIPGDAEASLMFVREGAKDDETTVRVPINVGDSTYDAPKVPQGAVRAYFSITRKGPAKISEHTGKEYHDIINLVPGQYATGIPLQVSGDDIHQDFDL